MNGARARQPALLVLADGEVFEGEAMGASAPNGVSTGELVFNTVLSGYQEVITDPSYAGQVVAFTYPHIGNYGVTSADDEAVRPWCRGVVVRDLPWRPSSWRSEGSLEDFLVAHGVAGITGIDTRRLTRHLRDDGAMGCAFGTAAQSVLAAAAASEPGTTGRDLVSEVTTKVPYQLGAGRWRVVAYDFGVKQTMLRLLGQMADVTVVPATHSAEDTLAMEPDGVFLSNGPGDPAALGAPRRDHLRLDRTRAGVRDLPRPPVAGPGARGAYLQASLRPPRRQPPGHAAVDPAGRNHQSEPQLRHRRRQPS